MMRGAIAVSVLITAILATPVVTLAQPPARPAALTSAQFDALCQLEAQPAHAAVLDVHATYKSDREKHMDFTRASDDFLTTVYSAGFPGTILLLLITAAPL